MDPTDAPSTSGDRPTADAAEITRFHVVDGVIQFLKRAAARRPLLLALDDLHRADGDSLYLFHWLARESADAPLLLLGAYRDGAVDDPKAAELTRVANQPRTMVLRLEGFGVEDVRSYVEQATTVRPSQALAGRDPCQDGWEPAVRRGGGSTPGKRRALVRGSGERRARLAIPATRRQAIADRLLRLSERCRRILGVAAVIGQIFTCDLVARVANEAAADRSGLGRRSVSASNWLLANDDEPGSFKFVHMLVRQVLYEISFQPTRTQSHARG